jgi:uncharacterized protein YndB with AHSA1/START domain
MGKMGKMGKAAKRVFEMRLGAEAYGEYLELVPPRRIVMSWCYAFGGEPEEHARTSRLEIDLAPIADGTELSFTHSGLFGEVSEERHVWGWSGSLGKLVRRVERAASSAGLTLEERE